MATIEISGEDLEVRFSALEKLGAFRGNVRVPLSAVTAVSVSRSPFRSLRRSVRAPGTGLPGVIALGTYRYCSGRDVAALYRRRPAVIVELANSRPRRLLVSVKDPDAVSAAVVLAASVNDHAAVTERDDQVARARHVGGGTTKRPKSLVGSVSRVCLEVAPVVRRQSQPALEVRVKREVQSGGRDRPPFFRPLGDGFWPDVKGALPALAGVALDVLVFGDGDLAALLGATAGLSAVVIVRAVRRPRGAPRRPWSEHMSPTTPGAGFGQGTGPVAAQPRVVGRARARRSRIAGRARLSGVRFDERFERLRLGAGAHRSCSQ